MPGPRVFEVHEVNELIPELVATFAALDDIKQRLRTLKIRINTLEMIWGDKVREKDNPDHLELSHHLDEMKQVQQEFERCTQRVAELGGQIKGVDPPLVDFYGVREGHLVHWCWTRGETEVTHWHHIDEGFAGRQPV
jgi:hypothetical protein